MVSAELFGKDAAEAGITEPIMQTAVALNGTLEATQPSAAKT